MKDYIFLTLLILSLVQFSCKKSKEVPETCDIVMGNRRMHNPYATSNDNQLRVKPSHQYCKFFIHTIDEYRALEKKGVYLQSLPMDEYTDKVEFPVINTARGILFYGIVPSSMDISAFDYEHLEDEFIPENKNANARVAEKTINGKVTFMDPIAKKYVALAGVRVIVKDVYKTAFTYTDEDGNFNITDSLLASDTTQILLEFSNDYYEIRTLNIENLLAIASPNKYSLGYKKPCGLTDMQIEIGPKTNNAALQHSAATLVSLNQYKKFATNNQFQFPVKKMVIWNAVDGGSNFSTPMLNNISQNGSANIDELLARLFGISGTLAPLLSGIIGDNLPDVYAPYHKVNSSGVPKWFIETMFHELTHASHYAQVGDDFWKDYIAYIFENGGYGDVSKPGSGMIQLSEAWAEDMSYVCAFQTYGGNIYLENNEDPYTDFIPYGIYYDIYDNAIDSVRHRTLDEVNGFTFLQMYQLLQSDVRTPNDFKILLKAQFPGQANKIDNLYSGYGL